MIDIDFIIKYTNGLYSTPKEYLPEYNEFRDMFSSGQLKSKAWLIDELKNLIDKDTKSIVIVGAWFGVLGLMINRLYPGIVINLVDIDSRCKYFVDNITYDIDNVKFYNLDMYKYKYNEDIIINTCCEHLDNVNSWIKLLPENKKVILQSNNSVLEKDHINCPETLDEFKKSVNLNLTYYNELEFPMYKRFMVIGTT